MCREVKVGIVVSVVEWSGRRVRWSGRQGMKSPWRLELSPQNVLPNLRDVFYLLDEDGGISSLQSVYNILSTFYSIQGRYGTVQ